MDFDASYVGVLLMATGLIALLFTFMARVLWWRTETCRKHDYVDRAVEPSAARAMNDAALHSEASAKNVVSVKASTQQAVGEGLEKVFSNLCNLKNMTEQLVGECCARPVLIDGVPVVNGRYFVFKAGGIKFSVELCHVKEVVEATRLIRPDGQVRKAINFDGVVVPVFDLSISLGQGPTDALGDTVIVILQVRDTVWGVLSSFDCCMVELQKNDIISINLFQGLLDDKFIVGVADVGGEIVNVLDVAQGGWRAAPWFFTGLVYKGRS